MAATAMIVFGIDLGGPGEFLGWRFPTRHGHPAVDWYEPTDTQNFGEQAAAHLVALKGVTPQRDGFDSDIAEDLWGVHMVRCGGEARERWLLVTHDSNVSNLDAIDPLNMRELVEYEQEWASTLRAALKALGIMPEPADPGWRLAAYES